MLADKFGRFILFRDKHESIGLSVRVNPFLHSLSFITIIIRGKFENFSPYHLIMEKLTRFPQTRYSSTHYLKNSKASQIYLRSIPWVSLNMRWLEYRSAIQAYLKCTLTFSSLPSFFTSKMLNRLLDTRVIRIKISLNLSNYHSWSKFYVIIFNKKINYFLLGFN